MRYIRSVVPAIVIAAGALSGAVSKDAMAALTWTTTNGATSMEARARVFADFDSSGLGPSGVDTSIGTFSGDWYLNGGVSPGGTGNWYSLGRQNGPTQTGELLFSNPVSYVGFRWGSTDAFNKLDVYGTTNNLLGTIYGIPDVTNPQVFGGVFFNLFDNAGAGIKKLVFTSLDTNGRDSNPWAFEVDNFSVVPAPGTLPLVAGCLGIVALVGRFRARRQAVASGGDAGRARG